MQHAHISFFYAQISFWYYSQYFNFIPSYFFLTKIIFPQNILKFGFETVAAFYNFRLIL
jgi:hypothetical protein